MTRLNINCLDFLVRRRFALLVVALGSIAACGNGEQGVAEVSELNWLAGCWVSAGETDYEIWMADESGLQGFAGSMAGGKLAFYEILAIVEENGLTAYVASPLGEGTTRFSLVSSSPGDAVFENIAHDYPQRIAYVLEGNSLTATISMADGGKSRQFVKQRCADE